MRFGCAGYALILVLVLLSHETRRWPFILFASVTPMLALLALPVLGVSLFALGRGTIGLAVLAISAFWPFAFHDDFVVPSGASCDDGACTTAAARAIRAGCEAGMRAGWNV